MLRFAKSAVVAAILCALSIVVYLTIHGPSTKPTDRAVSFEDELSHSFIHDQNDSPGGRPLAVVEVNPGAVGAAVQEHADGGEPDHHFLTAEALSSVPRCSRRFLGCGGQTYLLDGCEGHHRQLAMRFLGEKCYSLKVKVVMNLEEAAKATGVSSSAGDH
eukprot:GHVU01088051.1.p1 GENE.GHVU01088051.1~~GHVU01088051.1.p1  ORF type:complete len:160 (-),score=8.97 GHVU01088051.1:421-900(-)